MSYINQKNEHFKKSLDIQDNQIVDYIPYLLQDLWALGGDPNIVIKLLERNNLLQDYKKVIDLGCGKGATIIELALRYNESYKGIE